MSPEKPAAGSFKAWVLAARPATLWAAVAPVAVGTACAVQAGSFQLFPALAALAVALLVQIGTNFANDVFDFEKGADTADRVGPTRAVQAGLLTAGQMRRGMILAFALAILVGLYLSWIGGPWIFAIGVACVLSGIAYTGGPFPLAYHGLGDVFVLVFFGFVAVCGTAYLQVGSIPSVAWWSGGAVGCLATAILVVNNLRDRLTDAATGKRTLAVRLGKGFTLAEYDLLLLAAYSVPAVIVFKGLGQLWVLLPYLTLPLVARVLGRVHRDRGAALNRSLGGTARLLLLFSLLLSIGLVLS